MLQGRRIAALCSSRIFDPQHYLFIQELGEKLRADNIDLMIFCLNSDLYWDEDKYTPEAEIFEIIPMKLIDILVIMDEKIKSRRISEKLISNAKRSNIPVIVVDGEYENTSSVRFNYTVGFESVVRHIIEHHHVKKPHFLAGIKGNTFSEKRIEVFKKVIAENGIEFKPSMLSYGEFWAAPAREAIKKLIESGDIPDAVICANDIMAINTVDVLKEAGYRVPEDILVSGFDGYDEAELCSPKITTASCGCNRLSEAVCQNIINGIYNGKTEDILVEPVFIPRGSCGCEDTAEVSFSTLTRFNNGFYRFQDDIRTLYEISADMQMSDTPSEAASKLAQPIMHDLHCFVYTSCMETERNFFQNPLLKSEKYKFSLFYSAYNIGSVMQELNNDMYLEWTLEVLKNGTPLIFNELDYLGKPLGFVCYSFKDYDIINYAKTASITNTVSMGLGGFINARYQKYLADKLAHTYRRDQLTGLYNRNGFRNALEKLLADKESFGNVITIVMADLDGLKSINDTYGHEAGDTAISDAAFALKSSCPDNAICVRFGGDEMLALIPGECDIEGIFGTIDEKLSKKDHEYTVSLSCGAFTNVLSDDFDLTNAIKQADEKMYYNKRERKKQRS